MTLLNYTVIGLVTRDELTWKKVKSAIKQILKTKKLLKA